MKRSLAEGVCFLTSPLLDNLSLDNFSTFFVEGQTKTLHEPCSQLDRYLRQKAFLQNPIDPEECFFFDKKLKENEEGIFLQPSYSTHLVTDQTIDLLAKKFPGIKKFCVELKERTYVIISALERGHFSEKFDRMSVLFYSYENHSLLKSLDLPLVHLSNREKEVLRLFLKKETEQSIAERLELSLKRVEKYRSDLERKLNCDSLTLLFKKAALLLIWGLI